MKCVRNLPQVVDFLWIPGSPTINEGHSIHVKLIIPTNSVYIMEKLPHNSYGKLFALIVMVKILNKLLW